MEHHERTKKYRPEMLVAASGRLSNKDKAAPPDHDLHLLKITTTAASFVTTLEQSTAPSGDTGWRWGRVKNPGRGTGQDNSPLLVILLGGMSCYLLEYPKSVNPYYRPSHSI
jgi:hypothetical protein